MLSVLMRTLSLETTRDVGLRRDATHEATVRSANVTSLGTLPAA